MNALTPFQRLRQATSAYQESAVLAAAAELDLPTLLLTHDNSLTAAQAAGYLGADPRGLTMLLDVLAAQEYLVKTGIGPEALYGVAIPYVELLDSRHPHTFIPMIRHLAAVSRGWTRLSWVVQGKTPPETPSFLGREEEYKAFIWAMNSIARVLAKPTVAALRDAGVLDFPMENIRFLDVGGASGTYTQALLEALPASKGTLFDLPPGVEAAQKRFTGTELEPRVHLVEGNFYQDELPAGHDFVWVSAIIHQHGLTQTRDLFRKIFAATNPGGRIAVRDYMMNDARTAPVDGAFFGINMLSQTATGMVYTFAEVKEALQDAGFTRVRLAIPEETMSAVVTAEKQ